MFWVIIHLYYKSSYFLSRNNTLIQFRIYSATSISNHIINKHQWHSSTGSICKLSTMSEFLSCSKLFSSHHFGTSYSLLLRQGYLWIPNRQTIKEMNFTTVQFSCHLWSFRPFWVAKGSKLGTSLETNSVSVCALPFLTLTWVPIHRYHANNIWTMS